MANRICSFCGHLYTDETGHDYNQCEKDTAEQLESARKNLETAAWRFTDAQNHLIEVRKVAQSDWWKKKVTQK